jgi:chromosomal replication initiator protein
MIVAPAELLMNELIAAGRHHRMSVFKEKMRDLDVLILDDVHVLAGRGRTQEQFLHIFNALHVQGHQIVLTGDKAPHDLSYLGDQLRDRLDSGLVAETLQPDLQTRLRILEKMAGLSSTAWRVGFLEQQGHYLGPSPREST